MDPISLANLYFLSEWVIRLAMLAVVPLRREPDAAKGWLLLVFFLPWPGLALYLLIGSPRTPRWRREPLARLIAELDAPQRLRNSPNLVQPEVPIDLQDAVVLARNLGHLPILGGNWIELLDDYQEVVDRLVVDIDAAERHVHLAFYIFRDDHTTEPVLAALARATARGVHCRVMVDSLGSRRMLPTLWPKLKAAGVEAQRMLPVGLFRRKMTRFDLRNHRKIAVIDGRVAYTGSQNLVAADFRRGLTNQELMVRVTGPVALELQYAFVTDWYLERGELLKGESIFPEPVLTGAVAAQVVPSGPDFPNPNMQRLLIALVHGARRRLALTTPYFVPDQPLLQALSTAVLRGVDVHLIVSEQADQFLVCQAQRSYYAELLEAGIRIHLYSGRFLHAKHTTVDDEISLVGSSNLDVRSFQLNAEVTLAIYDVEVTRQLQRIERGYLAHCRELTSAEWSQRPWRTMLLQNMARMFSELL